MYLSDRKAGVLAKLFAALAATSNEREVRTCIGPLVLDLLDADFYASFVWCPERKRFESGLGLNMDESNLQAYERHYQFGNPLTPLLQGRHAPTLVSKVLPQDALMKTEFYADFLQKDGLHWGAGMYAWIENRNIGDVRIWREKRRSNFDQNDLHILELLYPAFVTSLQRARNRSADQLGEPESGREYSGASTLLTERERHIVKLASQGLMDKQIAGLLAIGLSTVRTHLRSAFRKLGVNNRVKLCRLLGDASEAGRRLN